MKKALKQIKEIEELQKQIKKIDLENKKQIDHLIENNWNLKDFEKILPALAIKYNDYICEKIFNKIFKTK